MVAITQTEFLARLEARAAQLQKFLAHYLSDTPQNGEISRPPTLMKAIRHGVLNGGKRMRPFLVLEVAAMLGAQEQVALYAAAGLECVHCYSLIHDDLPAMDDDDMRRGKPTVHKLFDDATAILAGDGLLTLAFEMTVHPNSHLNADVRCALIMALARDAGLGGMVGGQQLDLENENGRPHEALITKIHAMKTGALIRYACEAGALVAGALPKDVATMRRYGEIIGLAFQLADDLLDVTADASALGKATGKDAQAGKITQVGLHGTAWATTRLAQLVMEAEQLLLPYGEKADVLCAATYFIANRRH